MKKLAPYRKCIVAGVGSFFTMMAKSSSGGIQAGEIWQIAGATIGSALVVYLFPNGEKAKSIQT